MTHEKITQYLKAEIEDNVRQKPNREEYSTDSEYEKEIYAGDEKDVLLNKILDNIKHYDDEEDTKRYVDNFINIIRWTA